jgi:hypothetical protein
MVFETVFGAARDGWEILWFPAFGLVFVAIGALLVFAPDFMADILPCGFQGRARRIFSLLFFGFAVLWTLVSFVTTFVSYVVVAYDLASGHCSVVEGQVTDFRPMPYEGHSGESFVVSGQRFSYSDYVVTSGFHNAASHGGPIREGRYVRVSFRGNLIARLEVAR